MGAADVSGNLEVKKTRQQWVSGARCRLVVLLLSCVILPNNQAFLTCTDCLTFVSLNSLVCIMRIMPDGTCCEEENNV